MFDEYKYLILTHGIPGAGKTTFISNYFKEKSDVNVICPDDIREEFKNKKDEWKENFEYEIWKRVDERLRKSLNENKITIIDATFISRKSILKQYRVVQEINPAIKFIIVDFSELPLEYCLDNNRKRMESGGRFVPEDVIEDMYKRIQRTKLLEFEQMTISYKQLGWLIK